MRQLASHLSARQPLAAPAWLSPSEAALFARMPAADQLEGLRVLAELESWGYGADRNLLLAGLLHDTGKSLAPAKARYRVLITVLETVAPFLLPRLAARSATVGALVEHAAIGARLASEAGLPADVCALIAEHHRPAGDPRMAALQRADGLH